VPVYGLVEQAEQLAREISRLSQEADRISVLNPLNILYLRRIESKRAVLAPQVSQKLGEALGAIRAAVDNAPGLRAGFLQTWSLGQALAATLLLQNQWYLLVGTLDRKKTLTVAVLSIYLSVPSVLITLGLRLRFGWAESGGGFDRPDARPSPRIVPWSRGRPGASNSPGVQLRSNNGAPSGNEVPQDWDDCEEQKEVNQSSSHMENAESEEPSHDQNER
jgi:hypothetical protein